MHFNLYSDSKVFDIQAFVVLSFAAGMAQSGSEKRLLAEYANGSTDSMRVETLIKLCDEFTYSQPEKALQYYDRSRELSEKSGYELGLARSYERAGNIFFHQGKKEIARDHYLKALKVNQQGG
ncbi:MAG: tetratricopeptide repeat protein [Bacteroidales bacterium]|nr:tetratricopeptide repeat protein [Bacteroidales bacterium]